MDRATRVQTPSSRQLGGFSRHGEIRVSNGLHYVAFWFLFFRECDIAVTSAVVFIGARFGSRIALTVGVIVSRVSIPTRLARLPWTVLSITSIATITIATRALSFATPIPIVTATTQISLTLIRATFAFAASVVVSFAVLTELNQALDIDCIWTFDRAVLWFLYPKSGCDVRF